MLTWKDEIRELGADFCIQKKDVEKIIRDVEKLRIHGNTANYQRAWKRLFDLM